MITSITTPHPRGEQHTPPATGDDYVTVLLVSQRFSTKKLPNAHQPAIGPAGSAATPPLLAWCWPAPPLRQQQRPHGGLEGGRAVLVLCLAPGPACDHHPQRPAATMAQHAWLLLSRLHTGQLGSTGSYSIDRSHGYWHAPIGIPQASPQRRLGCHQVFYWAEVVQVHHHFLILLPQPALRHQLKTSWW